MKNKKLLFNHLLLRYNKSIGRLKRLSEKGLNFRRQNILSNRIEKIKQRLLSIKYALTKAAAVAGIASGVVIFQPNNVIAQNFQPAVVNPFLIDNINFGGSIINSDEYADIDSDGDIDIMIYSSSTDKLAVILNEGTPENPAFTEPVILPISLTEIEALTNICLGDLDADGDFDLLCGSSFGNFIYIENTGTPYQAEYSQPNINPFSLTETYTYDPENYSYEWSSLGNNYVEFSDLDGDGDLDIHASNDFYYDGYYGSFSTTYKYYYQNIGSPTSPNFTEKVGGIFGISGRGDIMDFDMDGDFDFLSSTYTTYWYYGDDNYPYFTDYNIYYEENIGSNTYAQFSSLTNPFGLNTMVDDWVITPELVDIDADNDYDLMFIKSPNNFYFYENKSCDSILTTISNFEGILTADQNGATYQWYTAYPNDTPIESATYQNYSPANSGNYFVQINLNNCYLNSDIIDFQSCQELLEGPNIFTTINGEEVFVYNDSAQYQWLDCNNEFAPIEGANSQFYQPNDNLSLAVSVSEGYCVDTASCYNYIFCDSVTYNLSIIDNTITFSTNNNFTPVYNIYYSWKRCGFPSSNFSTEQIFTPTYSFGYYLVANFGYCTIESDCIDYTNCNTISDNLLITGNTLTAQEDDCYYQWIQCDSINTPIEGETNQTFTPIESGSYAIEITLNNCFVTTECIDVTITAINDIFKNDNFSLIPNPTIGKLNVVSDKPLQNATAQIKSITGQVVFEQKNVSGANFVFDISENTNGLYFLEVTENGVTARLKIVKE